MTTRAIWDASKFSLATRPPTTEQRRITSATIAVVLVATACIAPFGAIQLQKMDGFIPATEAVIIICDLVVAALLASQAATIGSRALLLLASGFLFDALIIVPHMLTFPGAFVPAGLLGAGLQTTAWLFIFWHFGLPAAVVGYVCLPRERRAVTAAAIYRDISVVVGLVILLTWIVATYDNMLPQLFADRRGFTPMAHYVTAFDFAASVVALLALLARPRKSIFDLWLMVAVIALVGELAVTAFIMQGRFSLGFYASRFLSVAASITVLVALLAETVQQGVRLARTNLALQLERSRKLTSLDAALGAIVHEVRQPISSIANNSEAVQMILDGPAPDIEELREIAGEILENSLRANEIVKSIHGLFSESRDDVQPVEINGVVSRVVRGLQGVLHDNNVVTWIELETELPTIIGHKGQLQEVVFNLISNAIDAMKASSHKGRTLHVRTEKRNHNAIRVSVQDTGPGIEPEQMERIFDPFVTTKKGGMGMGLTICRMIVERHGGRLSALSDASTGTRFEFTLPIKMATDLGILSAEKATAVTHPRPLLRRPDRRTPAAAKC
jgi:signal transduction histidine kinase